ncbi:MAG: hypothetical protein RR086_05735 [Clostridia bacterium]
MDEESTMYNLMRQSEKQDDDGMDLDEAMVKDNRPSAEKFKAKYKEYYTDIKTDISEDW